VIRRFAGEKSCTTGSGHEGSMAAIENRIEAIIGD
jgi:hypothetical protein